MQPSDGGLPNAVTAPLVVREHSNCSFLFNSPFERLWSLWMIPVGKTLAGDGVMSKRFVYVIRGPGDSAEVLHRPHL
jgi:hypothetical protein